MKIRSMFFGVAICSTFAAFVPADEPKTQAPAAVDEAELTPEAQAVVEELRASLPPDSEAIAMLNDIVKGTKLGVRDGWFPLAKSQTRFDWKYVLAKFDKNADQKIEASEFTGSEPHFSVLDRDGDQQVTEADFDWSKSSLAMTPGLALFFMADMDANGKLTKSEFAQLYESFGGAEGGYLALDEVREQFAPPSSDSSNNSPDRPSRSTLIIALKQQEIGALKAGPALDEIAPEFSLTNLQGESVTLSQEIGDKPIVLIFGNFTCGPFRSHAGNIEKLVEKYSEHAKFSLVYVREAHPKGGWWMLSNQYAGIDVEQPTLDSERRTIAATCQQRLDLKIPFLVDTVDDSTGAAYSGMPNRLYLIDQAGRVAFKNGRGPYGFHPRQLEQALVLLLNEPPAQQQ